MLQFVKDIWQGRFQYGFALGVGGFNINRYTNGAWIFNLVGPNLESSATGHWPWPLFEASCHVGENFMWHVGLLGVTFGKCMEHDLDEEGHIAGPDRSKYYVFLKCINHMNKTFEEIIYNAK